MIITVTLNPAIDMWLTVPALEKGKFVRSEKERLNAGGKVSSLQGFCRS